ncbi:hypothetical protein DICPUDRAFT_150556 [Dictyostelium purpureum]|uniref:Oxysterol binding family protein n=1 Tax=Dictyostelium purpureum TaxID=5786 RepID=F0ZGM3_DICPU|nr:uncharacterized protein DICPUDRAFT_150556 [Dictyostelium purpureum]EGC36929.1 hypothetical protein DICPUDRAFT_150556 [Dictyostelium purpureum]|eukprot:XP_003286572.1 hypothetical protein DICPUDRAFT_150556 [Dictyostelium purpureum]
MTDISDDSKYQEGLEEEVLEDEIDDDLDINGSEESPKIEGQKKTGFIKQFVSSKQPFYKMSLPISYNEPRSLLEKFTDMGLFLDIFLKTPTVESEEQRFLEILKFYLSGWIQQKETKNPFNPIIGEVHTCKWEHADSCTEYIAEQISHHPPSSAFCFYNTEKGVILHSYLSPTSKFWGNSFESSMEGKIVFEIPSLDEEYIVEAPKIVVKGVVVGSLQTETIGSTNLVCKKTGYSAEIEFKGKGLFKNKTSMVAKVKHTSNKKSLYSLEGRWDGTVSITSTKSNDTTLFLDINSEGQKPILPTEDQQEDNYSRKVWKHVISKMLANNEDEAQNQKAMVEETQRNLAKSREAKQEKWVPVNFSKNSQDTFTFNKLSEARKEIISNLKK